MIYAKTLKTATCDLCTLHIAFMRTVKEPSVKINIARSIVMVMLLERCFVFVRLSAEFGLECLHQINQICTKIVPLKTDNAVLAITMLRGASK